MDFCSASCLSEGIKRNHADHRCWECDAVIKISNSFVHTEYVEAQPRQFCSAKCLLACMDAIEMCKYCQTVIWDDDDIEQANDKNVMEFCSNCCEDNYKRIICYIELASSHDCQFCSDCNQIQPAALNLFYKKQLYPFCSFACFSYTQKSCGIHAGNGIF